MDEEYQRAYRELMRTIDEEDKFYERVRKEIAERLTAVRNDLQGMDVLWCVWTGRSSGLMAEDEADRTYPANPELKSWLERHDQQLENEKRQKEPLDKTAE